MSECCCVSNQFVLISQCTPSGGLRVLIIELKFVTKLTLMPGWLQQVGILAHSVTSPVFGRVQWLVRANPLSDSCCVSQSGTASSIWILRETSSCFHALSLPWSNLMLFPKQQLQSSWVWGACYWAPPSSLDGPITAHQHELYHWAVISSCCMDNLTSLWP